MLDAHGRGLDHLLVLHSEREHNLRLIMGTEQGRRVFIRLGAARYMVILGKYLPRRTLTPGTMMF